MLNSRQGHSRPALCARRPLELCSERAVGHAQQPAERSLTKMCSQWKGASLTSTSSWLYQRIFRETNRDRIMHVITIIFYPTINKSEHYPAEGVLHLRKGKADPYLQRQARQLSSSGRSQPSLLGRLSLPARLSPSPPNAHSARFLQQPCSGQSACSSTRLHVSAEQRPGVPSTQHPDTE